ncbi:hypothetical protein PIB30_024408, partial [Stylosanthes scabra]|nr:hypothetical protein [Stylosanthes scabra]
MAEVIAMGFPDLEDMPNWTVKQELFLHLASKFDLENNLIRDDVGMINVNASVIERAIRLPSYGYDFPDYAPANNRFAALKLRWGQVTLTDLKAFVIECPMGSNEERREFREAFILLLAKSFLCPTTNNYISPERHLPLVVDVANPRTYNWKPDVRSAKYHDGPLFSLGPDFNTPTPSPDGPTSKDAEVLDIPPIREILPENIVLNAEEDPCTIRLKPLTSEEEKKIYNLNTTITDHNLEEYHKHGTYVGMCPNLGADGKNFDRDKASNRKWWLLPVCNRLHWYLYAFNLDKKELLVLDSMHDHAFDDLRRSLDTYVGRVIENMLKIVIPTFDHKGVGFPTRYAEVPKQPNNDDCGIYVIKFMEDWKPDSILNEYTN